VTNPHVCRLNGHVVAAVAAVCPDIVSCERVEEIKVEIGLNLILGKAVTIVRRRKLKLLLMDIIETFTRRKKNENVHLC
jgi:hypothetical protein